MSNEFKFEDYSHRTKEELRAVSVQALTKVGLLIEAQAKTLATVATGNLRDSINHIVKEYGGEVVAQVGTSVDYAFYVEFGTGEFAVNGLGRKGGWVYRGPSGEWFFTWGQEPQPFIKPAFKRKRKQAQEVIANTFKSSFGGGGK